MPGSAGDSLRQAATYQLFRDLDIEFSLLSETESVDDAVVVIGGGGNLVPAFSSARKALLRTAKAARHVIVLPHTVRGNEELLEDLGPEVEIYCRDPESYVHVLAHRSRARAQLAHDMAFRIDIDRLRSSGAAAQAAALLAEKLPARPIVQLMTEAGHAFVFRAGTKRIRPKSSVDISSLLKTGTGPHDAEIGALALLSHLETVKEIYTDRLDVGIAGAILGKRVCLYDDSDGIVASVYRHSLHTDFPNVQLII